MIYRIKFGEIVIEIQSERVLNVESELPSFFIQEILTPDVRVKVSWKWEEWKQPNTEMLGEDPIQEYYVEGNRKICTTKGGPKGYVAAVNYTGDCSEMDCYINEKPFIVKEKSLGQILRFLPMRAIFQRFGILFFHASQIGIGDTGILFTGPSGAGKTTQARLWQQHEDAKIICNDRTLVRFTDEEWKTFGYPIDGSTPVRSTEVHQLGCIVYVSKAQENSIERMRGAKAITTILPQTVIDIWNGEAIEEEIELLGDLLNQIPIYKLRCTPDRDAVECLKAALRKDGIQV